MPSFGGLFSRRNKSSSGNTNRDAAPTTESSPSLASVSELDSLEQSPSMSDKKPSRSNPPYAALPAASSSKLKLPFLRKQSHAPNAETPAPSGKNTLQSLPSIPHRSSAVSDDGHLPQPPPKSSIFSGYRSPSNAASAQSLASEISQHHFPSISQTTESFEVQSEVHDVSPPPQPPKKPGLFAWKERRKSRPTPPPVVQSSTDLSTESFNLKSFRHVNPESPSAIPDRPPSTMSDCLPPVRPRGSSIASDASSQRISVAAFREAQARRSAANSPVPSYRRSASIDPFSNDNINAGRDRISMVSVAPSAKRRDPSRRLTAPALTSHRSSKSDSSESDQYGKEDDAESDDSDVPLDRKRTLTQRSAIRAKSDLGHGISGVFSSSRIESLKLDLSQTQEAASRSTPSLANYSRPRASVSTSALLPDAAARRASVLASANVSAADILSMATPPPLSASPMHKLPRRSSDSDSDASSIKSVDSEDKPLADLVRPRTPASTRSSVTGPTGPRPRVPSKPLIDIKSLVGHPPAFTPPWRREENERDDSPSTKDKEDKSTSPVVSTPISLSPLQIPTDRSSSLQTPSPGARSVPVRVKDLSRYTNQRKSTGDIMSSPTSPTSPSTPKNEEVSLISIRLVSDNSQSVAASESSKVALPTSLPTQVPQVLPPSPSDAHQPPTDDSQRIVPLPIRERKPPSPFTVMSRPQHRSSTVDTPSAASPITPSPSTSMFSSNATQASPSPTWSLNVHSETVRPLPPSQSIQQPRPRSQTVLSQSLAFSQSESSTILMPSSKSSSSQSDISSAASVTTPLQKSPPASSSRIPAKTLIETIPDSPSLKPGPSPPSRQSDFSRPPFPRLPSSASSGRPQSSTLVSLIPPAPSPFTNVSSFTQPQRPFAGAVRRESPASSTGDSSSGRAPLTPRDGSDLGIRSRDDDSEVGSTIKARGHAKRSSVTFDEPLKRGRERERERADRSESGEEERRKDRRRSEAKAAIELGKIVNGRRPIVDDDSDGDVLLNPNVGPRMSMLNPNMGMGLPNGMSQEGWAPWSPSQFPLNSMMPMVPPNFVADPNFLAAHQQALLLAKQAYQLAVAQQAVAAAGDLWERESSLAGFGGGSSAFGGASGAGMYGPSAGIGMPVGMGMPPLSAGMVGMGGNMHNQWSTNSVQFPSAPRSIYGGMGSSQSEYRSSGGGGWGSRSVYGESFGPAPDARSSRVYSSGQVPTFSSNRSNFAPSGNGRPQNSAASVYEGSAPRPRTRTNPVPSAAEQLREMGKRPPSSWKTTK